MGMGRCQLDFVPVQFVGRMQSHRFGPLRHVRGEPLRATTVRATTVSSRPRSALQIAAIAAQQLRAAPSADICMRMLLGEDDQLSQFVGNDVV